jgi:hypothetical protein
MSVVAEHDITIIKLYKYGISNREQSFPSLLDLKNYLSSREYEFSFSISSSSFSGKKTLLKLTWNFYYPEKSAPNDTLRTKENVDKESRYSLI